MNRSSVRFTLALIALCSTMAVAQTVNVTVIVNTSTVPDTLWPVSVVQMRGDTPPLQWNGSTGVNFTNIGGDYWSAVVAFPANATIQYKFFTNASSASGDNENKGWENDILDPTNNRVLTTGTADTTLPVQFVNGSANKVQQYWRPWPVNKDSIAVRVRVNMQGWQAFNPATDRIGVRGAAYPGYLGTISWAHTMYLAKEDQHGNGGSRQYNADNFYSGTILIPRDSVAEYQKIEYKFVIATSDPDADPKTWESINNRSFTVPAGKADTTLHWVWFNDTRPVPFAGADTLNITWRVDMTKAIQTRGFKTGDTVLVSTGWNGTGRDLTGNSPVRTILTKKGFTNVYEGQQQVIAQLGGPLYYQYYVTKEGQDIRESFYNFEYTGNDNSLAERRMVTPDALTLTYEDIVDSKTDMHRMPTFRNLSVLARNVLVNWVCDLRPAYYQTSKGDTLFDIQGTDNIWDPTTVYTVGLWMNGPATGEWTTWGQTLRDAVLKQMFDDGTHGDAVAGDHFYTVQMMYSPDSTGSKKYIGQEFKFGLKGGDNEGGKGGFGNNHYENIDDSQSEVTITSAFGSINPKYYNAWDYNSGTPTAVERLGGVPVVYRLDQNYPNPFNPSTNITYAVTKPGWVTLKVYNTLGRYLTTLVSGPADPGEYRVAFDAGGFESGVYLYELTVDGFTQVRKMTLIK